MSQTTTPAGTQPAGMPVTATVRHLWHWSAPVRGRILALMGGLLLDLGFNAGMPLAFGVLVDRAIPDGDRGMLVRVLVVMAAATVVASLAAAGRDRCYAEIGIRVVNDLRRRMFTQLGELSPSFYQRTPAGDVMSRFGTDLAAVHEAVVYAIPEAVLGIVGIAVYLGVLASIDPVLTLLPLAGFPLLLIAPRRLGRQAERAVSEVRSAESAVTNAVCEQLRTQRIVAAYGLTGVQSAAFERRLGHLTARAYRFNLLSYLAERAPNIGFALLQLVVVGVGASRAVSGDLAVGSLVAFTTVMATLAGAVGSLTRTFPLLLAAGGSVERIQTLLAETPAIPETPGARPAPLLSKALTLTDVEFAYPGTYAPQLDGVSLTIRAGERVALVGTSGSGKSTVLSLLQRAYDPQQGRVTIDGVDLRDVSQASLRSQYAVVFQDSCLFDTTVTENIRMGRLDATDAEVRAAAAAAGLLPVIERLPAGWDTILGEGAVSLSGGQRQRLALARALVRRPRVLFLDEATSALDPATAAGVDATVAALPAETTVIAVTHRLRSAVSADRIFVFDAGRIVESGTHAELVARGGLYRRLWDAEEGGNDRDPDAHETIDPKGAICHDPCHSNPSSRHRRDRGAGVGRRRPRSLRYRRYPGGDLHP